LVDFTCKRDAANKLYKNLTCNSGQQQKQTIGVSHVPETKSHAWLTAHLEGQPVSDNR